MRLLAVAQKLAPMIQESFQSIKEEITQLVGVGVAQLLELRLHIIYSLGLRMRASSHQR